MARRRKQRSKRQLVQGDQIMMLAEPKKRAPVKVDRSVPLDYEQYLAEKHERERLEARDRLVAAATRPIVMPSEDLAGDSGGDTVGGHDSGGDDGAYFYDGATDEGQETQS